MPVKEHVSGPPRPAPPKPAKPPRATKPTAATTTAAATTTSALPPKHAAQEALPVMPVEEPIDPDANQDAYELPPNNESKPYDNPSSKGVNKVSALASSLGSKLMLGRTPSSSTVLHTPASHGDNEAVYAEVDDIHEDQATTGEVVSEPVIKPPLSKRPAPAPPARPSKPAPPTRTARRESADIEHLYEEASDGAVKTTQRAAAKSPDQYNDEPIYATANDETTAAPPKKPAPPRPRPPPAPPRINTIPSNPIKSVYDSSPYLHLSNL